MPTLILSPLHTENNRRLWWAASTLGWKVERLIGYRITDDILAIRDPVLYLDVLSGPLIARDLGVTLAEPPDDWLVHLPAEYRGRDVQLATLGEARTLPEPMFVKPPNDKSFPAKVYAGAELPADVPGATPVLIQEVVVWEKEFRCFVLDREVRAFSVYLRGGELARESGYESTEAEDAEMLAFARRVLADQRVALPRAVALDVGLIAGRGWAVVEANGAWASGVYGCDPIAALEVIEHATTRDR